MRLRLATSDDLAWVDALARHPEIESSLALGAREGLPAAVERGELLVDEDRRAAARLVAVVERHGLAAIRTVMVDPSHQGRGVGLALVTAVIAEAFDARGLRRLEAEAYAYNVAGCRLFERAGFTREGVRRRAWKRHGAWQDGVIYGLLADER